MSRELATVLVKPVWSAYDDAADNAKRPRMLTHPGTFSTLSGPSVTSRPPMISAAKLYRKLNRVEMAVNSTALIAPMRAVKPNTRPVLT